MLLRRIHAATAFVFVGAIVVQVFLAGAAIANLGGTGDFRSHVDFGYTWVGLAALAVLVTALLARRPRTEVGTAAALLVLYIVQTLLPAAKASMPTIAALHPVTAMLLFGLGAWYSRRAWAGWSA
jgi:hypothetical protein